MPRVQSAEEIMATLPPAAPQQASPAWTQPAQAEPKQEETSFFLEPQVVYQEPNLQHIYDASKKAASYHIARNVSNRKFQSLKEYEDFIKSTPGAVEEIKPDLQKMGEAAMPSNIRAELNALKAAKARKIAQQSEMKRIMQYRDLWNKSNPDDQVIVDFSSGKAVLKKRHDIDQTLKEERLKSLKESQITQKLSQKVARQRLGEEEPSTQQAPAQPQGPTQKEVMDMMQQIQANPNDPRAQQALRVMQQMGMIK